jgi:hypothetical protein
MAQHQAPQGAGKFSGPAFSNLVAVLIVGLIVVFVVVGYVQTRNEDRSRNCNEQQTSAIAASQPIPDC